MPTPKQLQLIHFAARQVWGPSCDASYRMLLRNVADAETAKSLTQVEFEDCMAVLEDLGFHDAVAPRYWRNRVESRGSSCGPRMAQKIHALATESRYELAALCLRFSEHRTVHAHDLYPREAWNLIEMLKASNYREAEAEVKEAEHHG